MGRESEGEGVREGGRGRGSEGGRGREREGGRGRERERSREGERGKEREGDGGGSIIGTYATHPEGIAESVSIKYHHSTG